MSKEFTQKQEETMGQALYDLLYNIANYMGVSGKMNQQYIDEAVAKYMTTVKETVKIQEEFEKARNEDN